MASLLVLPPTRRVGDKHFFVAILRPNTHVKVLGTRLKRLDLKTV